MGMTDANGLGGVWNDSAYIYSAINFGGAGGISDNGGTTGEELAYNLEVLAGSYNQHGSTFATYISTNQNDQTATLTVTQTSDAVKTSDANGGTWTVNQTSTWVTVSTADGQRGNVVDGGIAKSTTTIDANGSHTVPDGSAQQLGSNGLTPLALERSVGMDRFNQLEAAVKPSFWDGIAKHKWAVGGAWVAATPGVVACIVAEPCGVVLGTGAALGVLGAGAATVDAGLNP